MPDLNDMTHPGEKRLVEICKKSSRILPADFEKNIHTLLDNMFNKQTVAEDAERIVRELEAVLSL